MEGSVSIRGTGHSLQTAVLLFSLLFVASCAPVSRSTLEGALKQGFVEILFRTERFTLFGLLRSGRGETLHVYVEGDGHAWETSRRPSADPTPRNPVALRLAMADETGVPVLYLARPCQYVQRSDRCGCHARYWTSARLCEEVIASLDDAVSQAKSRAGTRNVALFGFSGGGGAAVLIAARRGDVACLATVAGLLDTDGWTTRMHVSPLAESLNPLKVAPRLRSLPQLHLCSQSDKIIPLEIVSSFCVALGRPECLEKLECMDHGGDWDEVWPSLLHNLLIGQRLSQ